jgi:hypothetical protein
MISISFEKITESREEAKGANFLMMEVVERMITNIFKFERQEIALQPNLERKIIAIERSFDAIINLPLSNEVKQIKIKGKVDRLEKVGDTYRIIDYKTGKIDVKETSIDQLTKKPEQYGKLIQLLYYNLLLTNNNYHPNEIRPCLYSMIRPSSGFIGLQEFGLSNDEKVMESFNDFLFQTFQSMLNTSEIRHNSNSNYCEYCD